MTGKVCPQRRASTISNAADSVDLSELLPGFVAPPSTPMEGFEQFTHPPQLFDVMNANEIPPLQDRLLSPGTRLDLMERKSRRRSIFIGSGLLLLAVSLAAISEFRHRMYPAFGSAAPADEGPDFAVDGSGKIHDLHHRIDELKHDARETLHGARERARQTAQDLKRDVHDSAAHAKSRGEARFQGARNAITTESQSFMDKLREIVWGRTPPRLDAHRRARKARASAEDTLHHAQEDLQQKVEQAKELGREFFNTELKDKIGKAVESGSEKISEEFDEVKEAAAHARGFFGNIADLAANAFETAKLFAVDAFGNYPDMIGDAFDDVEKKAEQVKDDVEHEAMPFIDKVRRMFASPSEIDQLSARGHDAKETVKAKLHETASKAQHILGEAKNAMSEADIRERLDQMFDAPGEIKQTVQNAAHDAYEQASEKLHDLRDRAQDAFDDASIKFQDRAHHLRPDAQAALDKASEKLHDIRGHARDTLEHASEKLHDHAQHAQADLKGSVRRGYHDVRGKANDHVNRLKANIEFASEPGQELKHEAVGILQNLKANVEKLFGNAKDAVDDSSVVEKLEEMFDAPGEIKQTVQNAAHGLYENAAEGAESLKTTLQEALHQAADKIPSSESLADSLRDSAAEIKEHLTSAPRAEDVLGTRAFETDDDRAAIRPYAIAQKIFSTLNGIASNTKIVAQDTKAEVKRNAAHLADNFKELPRHHQHPHRHAGRARDAAFRTYHHATHKTMSVHDEHYDAEHLYTELMNEHADSRIARPSFFARFFGFGDEPVCKLKASEGWRRLQREHAESLTLGPHQLYNDTQSLL